MKTIKGQLLMSTLEDSQGERRDKRFLEEIVARVPKRVPLGQDHDASLPNVVFIENFRLEELTDHPGEWCISGDVAMQDGQDWSKGGGFSFSAVEVVKRREDPAGTLYVPYPFYRDESALEEILAYDPQLQAGRWVKKSAELALIALIVTSGLWVLQPARDKFFNEVVWPFLDKVLKKYREGRFKDIPFEYGSVALGKNGEKINIRFIPERRNSAGTFTKELVKGGLEKAMAMIAEDKKGAAVGIKEIKLYYHNPTDGYRIESIQYADGQVIHHVT